jgi:hypothetical protein
MSPCESANEPGTPVHDVPRTHKLRGARVRSPWGAREAYVRSTAPRAAATPTPTYAPGRMSAVRGAASRTRAPRRCARRPSARWPDHHAATRLRRSDTSPRRPDGPSRLRHRRRAGRTSALVRTTSASPARQRRFRAPATRDLVSIGTRNTCRISRLAASRRRGAHTWEDLAQGGSSAGSWPWAEHLYGLSADVDIVFPTHRNHSPY